MENVFVCVCTFQNCHSDRCKYNNNNYNDKFLLNYMPHKIQLFYYFVIDRNLCIRCYKIANMFLLFSK